MIVKTPVIDSGEEDCERRRREGGRRRKEGGNVQGYERFRGNEQS